MEFELLNESYSQKIVSHFFERYAVPKNFFNDFVFLRNIHFIWLANSSLSSLIGSFNFYSVGFLFLMDFKTFKPTTAAIRFLSSNIKRNILSIDKDQTKKFFSGIKFKISNNALDSTGYIAVKSEDYFLGSAFFDKKKLTVFPNISRTDYDKIEARFFLKNKKS